jgi:DNA polymerase-3 subunit delta'
MALADVEGQQRAVEALRTALRADALHHAWLFAGPAGVGKELTALGLAQALLCPERPNEGCGSCVACGRVARRNHPDVQWLMPEDEQVARGFAGRSDFTHTPSREIRVEQIRVLQERLALRPLEGGRRVVIAASAHKMNPAAQNAFLKTLEEPPPGTVIVLIASEPDRLLPTIRSRCSRAQFGPLPEALVARKVQEARKVDGPTAALMAALSGGSIARALAMDPAALQRRREIIDAFEALDFGDARTLLGFAELYGASREDAEEALAVLEVWTRDVAVARAGGQTVVNRDLAAVVAKAAGRVSEGLLHARHRLLEQARAAIAERNAQARLQLEALLFTLAKESGAGT